MPTSRSRGWRPWRYPLVYVYLAVTAVSCSTAQVLLDGDVHRWVWGG